MPPTRPEGLSARENAALTYLRDYLRERGWPPTVREIGDAIGVDSTSLVSWYLDNLARAGYIQREPRITRGLRLVVDPTACAHCSCGSCCFCCLCERCWHG